MSEFVMTTEVGKHNLNLPASAGRVLESGSWKQQRIVVLIPAAASIPSKVALSHWNLIFPPNQGVYRILCLGMEVGHAYSEAINQILSHPDLGKWEFILTVEHDNAPPPDGVLKLIKRMEQHPELACIGGLYWTKGEGGCTQIWGDIKDPVLNFRSQAPVPGQLVECYGTGMGFNLWRLSMFKELKAKKEFKQPFFETKASANGVGTQDLAFWTEARKFGYRCAIDCDVLVGHFDERSGIMW
jgi:hypothetical protein